MFNKDVGIDDVEKLKEKAEKLLLKGKHKQALEAFEKIGGYLSDDPKALIKMGDIARRLDEKSKAVEHYKAASEVYVKQGFIIKAIATCKLITSIDPSRTDVQERLTELYAKEGIVAAGEGASSVTQAAIAPSGEPEGAPSGAATKTRAFPRTPLFSDFTREELAEVVSKVSFRSFASGERVFVEGDPGDSIFIVVGGEADALGLDESGVETVRATFVEGDFFGEFAFFSGSSRTGTVRASGDVELLELTREVFDEIAATHPHVTKVLFEFYKERVVDGLMASSYVFSPMSREDRSHVLKNVTMATYESGADVMRQGEEGDTMYLIKSGFAQVWIKDADGERKDIKELHEGEFFGEMAIASNKPRTATVTAGVMLEAMEFKRPLIKAIIDRYPAIKDALVGVIKERLDETK